MTRCGHIAILGAPNAGKSTLVNRLCGQKIAIVTPKAQTTRARMRGICMAGDAQLILIDTPGIFSTEKSFEKNMVREAWAGAKEADALLVLIDAEKGLDENVQAIIASLQKRKSAPVLLAINKVDAVKKPYLLKLAEAVNALGLFDEIFMISAKTGDGVEDVKRTLAKLMPEAPWLYPEDHLTDAPMRELAAEITREKLFLLLRQELPYSLKVETEQWEEQKNGAVKISQVISVEREGQKKIVIGAGGDSLKKIGTSARLEIEKMLGQKVFLQLFVKVDEGWKER